MKLQQRIWLTTEGTMAGREVRATAWLGTGLRRATLGLAVTTLTLLGACGGRPESSSRESAPPELQSEGQAELRSQPPPVKDTAFGDMVGTMDKARGVQSTVDDQKRELDRQVQSAEGNETP